MEGFDQYGFAIYGAPIVRPVVAQNLHEAHVLEFQSERLMSSIRQINAVSPAEYNRRFVAQADENRARGWAND